MVRILKDILSTDILESILLLSDVKSVKERVDILEKGYISFSIDLNVELKNKIKDTFNLDLGNVSKLPMRWIKGDTELHTDKQQKNDGSFIFENTYLVYLTDSEGSFMIDNQEYPILKNMGYVFPEGINHETINTGNTPRLLLGPFSDEGLMVGGAGSTLTGVGGSTVYIKEDSGTIFYSYDNVSWSNLYFPVTVQNTDVSPSSYFNIKFSTDLTLSNVNDYFICNSSYLQFGSTELKDDGTRPVITITTNNYDGLIENGSSSVNGFNHINVFNIVVDGSGYTLQIGAGWVGKKYFGAGAIDNYIINCSSNGDISDFSGGIVGSYSPQSGVLSEPASLTIIGCSSSGQLSDQSGGIVGSYAGSVNADLTIKECYSTGLMSGDGVGGILGANSNKATIENCYSYGTINGNNVGGIVGGNAGSDSVTITNCYTTGNIVGSNSGGICGSLGPVSPLVFTVSITNCYTLGNLNNTSPAICGGICGPLISIGGSISVTISNCYTIGTVQQASDYIIGNVSVINGLSGDYVLLNNYSEAGSPGGNPGTWSTLNANTVLQGVPSSEPGVGLKWASLGSNQSYQIANMGYTPYSTTNISGSPPDLVTTTNMTLVSGNVTMPGLISGLDYRIIKITGGDIGSYSSITIDNTTGVISTLTSTVPNMYTIIVYNSGSYNISTVQLTVNVSPDIPCLTEDTMVLTPSGYINVKKLKKGDAILTSDNRKVKIVKIVETVVNGRENTYPCIIPKNSIAMNYPSNDLRISQTHLIKYSDYWIFPRNYFPKDRTYKQIHYYHIQLKNYSTDHLVINGGVVVESLAVSKEDCIEYYHRSNYSILLYQIKKSSKSTGTSTTSTRKSNSSLNI